MCEVYTKDSMSRWCNLGIAATDAVDELTKQYPGRSEGFDHEGWLIAVGKACEEKLTEIERTCSES